MVGELSSEASAGSSPRRCPACQGPLSRWRPATCADSSVVGHEGPYELLRCGRCGTAVTEGVGVRDGSPELYEGGYYARPPRWLDMLVEPLRWLADRGKIRWFNGLTPGSRVFEFGAGDGRLLSELSGRGMEVSGVEPSESARIRARERSVELAGDLSLLGETETVFDAVICWHVLEHLADPASDLRTLSSMLEPRGRLVVSVPNLASLQAKIGGDRWFAQDVPRHLTHFTSLGVEELARRCGLEVSRFSSWSLEQGPFGMWQTLLNRITGTRDVLFKALKRQPLSAGGPGGSALGLLALVLAVPLAVVAVPLEILASLAGRGGATTVVLRPIRGGG